MSHADMQLDLSRLVLVAAAVVELAAKVLPWSVGRSWL